MEAREAAAPPPDDAGKPADVVAAAPTAGTAAAAATTTQKSPLDKPLHELTEEDIAQVTREDCRRFLKEKGMRRPSWNKSQAIQQVISLKALLEDRQDADDDAPSTAAPAIPAFFAKRPPDPPFPGTAPQISVPPSFVPLPRGEAAAAEPQIGVPGSLSSPYGRDPAVPAFTAVAADASCHFPAAGVGTLPPSSSGLPPRVTNAEGEDPAGQLTIFYDGKISVYDSVTPEKARVIMQIAASPSCYDFSPLPPPSPSLPSRLPQCPELAQPPPPPQAAGGGGSFFRPPSSPVPALACPSAPPAVYPQIPQHSGRFPHHLRESVEEWRIPREVDPECPTSRAASLQRYLEKRKDRFKCKKNVVRSSSMEIYLSPRMRDQMPNGQLSSSEMRSPTQPPRPPQTPTRCNSIENPAQNIRISIDLNDDGEDILHFGSKGNRNMSNRRHLMEGTKTKICLALSTVLSDG